MKLILTENNVFANMVVITTVVQTTIMEVTNIMFMTNLSILARYSRIFCERKLSESNIGFNEQSVLMYLYHGDRVNQDTIAKHFMLDKGAIAKTVNKLEEKQLITRIDNPSNKREKLVEITELGKSNFNFYNSEINELHRFLFEGLSEEEISQFNRSLEIITKNVIKTVHGRMMDYDENK
jgi:DNA-binding MarR family transcriptional regulator